MNEMNTKEKELYQKKLKAQLDEWNAKLDQWKAKAEGSSVDAKLEMNRNIEKLEDNIEKGTNKIAELAKANDDNWEKVRDNVEDTWKSLTDGVKDLTSKFTS
ncbi:MAG: coiled coil domain-containing protein [Bacteroidetes bacterium]|nr:coiled coil domain-containing protein [Bacteroidota bacterium]